MSFFVTLQLIDSVIIVVKPACGQLNYRLLIFLLSVQAIQQAHPPTIFVPSTHMTVPTMSPSQHTKNRTDSRELACADTSGIGSSNTSPRQSSRPSSVPSGNGSVIVQAIEDQDMEVIDVKKEREETPTGNSQLISHIC